MELNFAAGVTADSSTEPDVPSAQGERVRTVSVVLGAFAAYVGGLFVAAIAAYQLTFAVARVTGFIVGIARLNNAVIERSISPTGLALAALTWLVLVFVVLRLAACFVVERHRARAVWVLAAVIAISEAARAFWPIRPLPWLRYRDHWTFGASRTTWPLAFIELQRHPVMLASCVALVPCMAWYVSRVHLRAKGRTSSGRQGPSWRVLELPAAPPTSAANLWLVCGSAIALALLSSLLWLTRAPDVTQLNLSSPRLLRTLLVESVLLLVWVPRLRARGWTFDNMSRPFRALDVLHAIALVLVSFVAVRLTFHALFFLTPGLAHTIARYRTFGPLSWWVIAPVLLVSPLAEESLYFGFAATVLSRRWRMPAAFLTVVAIRMLVHVYQGPLALVGVLPLAIVFTLYYLRTARLWPVVLAHVIIDSMALAAIAARP